MTVRWLIAVVTLVVAALVMNEAQVTITPVRVGGGPTLASNGTAAAPSYTFASQPNVGMYLYDTAGVAFASAGTGKFYLGGSLSLADNTPLQWTNSTVNPNTTSDVLMMRAGAAGRLNLFAASAQNVGVGLDFATDGVLKVRTRAQTGDAALTASTVTTTGNITTGVDFVGASAGGLYLSGSSKTYMYSPANGVVNLANAAITVGSQLKVDALPTISAGFGTSPSITAGSTAFAGSVNVGTGGTATTGTITFGGTAFPSVPFCTYSDSTSNIVTRGTPTTTTLVLNATTPWLGSDVISWICVSSK